MLHICKLQKELIKVHKILEPEPSCMEFGFPEFIEACEDVFKRMNKRIKIN